MVESCFGNADVGLGGGGVMFMSLSPTQHKIIRVWEPVLVIKLVFIHNYHLSWLHIADVWQSGEDTGVCLVRRSDLHELEQVQPHDFTNGCFYVVASHVQQTSAPWKLLQDVPSNMYNQDWSTMNASALRTSFRSWYF